MKIWIVFATWLFCYIATTSCLNVPITYPTVTFTTHLGSVGSYQSFMSSLRKSLESKSESHGIPLLLKPSEITDKNKYLLVELINYDSKLRVTLALTVVDVYIIGYKSGNNSFFLKDAPSDATKLLFDKTTKKTLSISTNYNNLGDRTKVGLGIGAMKKAIDTLSKFDGVSTGTTFKESLLIAAQMVSEAARFKFIQLKIEGGIVTEYKPGYDTISFENSWDKLSARIQQSGTDGVFKEPLTLQNANGTNYVVKTVAQVKPDISLLHYYVGSGEQLSEKKNFGEFMQMIESVEESMSVL